MTELVQKRCSLTVASDDAASAAAAAANDDADNCDAGECR